MCELTVSLTQSGCRILNYSWPTSITERILSYVLTQWQLLMRFWCSGKFSWVNCNPMKASLSTDYSNRREVFSSTVVFILQYGRIHGDVTFKNEERIGHLLVTDKMVLMSAWQSNFLLSQILDSFCLPQEEDKLTSTSLGFPIFYLLFCSDSKFHLYPTMCWKEPIWDIS